ncbi:hypothetical protein BJ912DRAFT_355289 [Pholiota molesta]|nr:hypothetical protein BJ912DRAFT_355289 [Pholiota molesta]
MSILPLDDSCLRIYFYPESWWTLAWVEGDQKERTSTLMEAAGATVFITFTSTYISVCDTIPRSRPGQGPARASFNIDRGAPTAYVYLALPHSLQQQLLFQTFLLSPSLHTFINNLGGAGGATYVVDFIPLSTSNVLAERSHVEDLPLAMTTLTASERCRDLIYSTRKIRWLFSIYYRRSIGWHCVPRSDYMFRCVSQEMADAAGSGPHDSEAFCFGYPKGTKAGRYCICNQTLKSSEGSTTS